MQVRFFSKFDVLICMQDACLVLKGKVAAKPANTLDILEQETYDFLKDEAEKEGTSVRKHVNNKLDMIVAKTKFMRQYMPKLKKLTFEDGTFFIYDANKNITTRIGLNKGLVFCESCDSNECVHVMYSFSEDEIGFLEPFKSKR